ncbi:Uncharacterised protein [Segatella copri]|nr:Uncharacterised protein [Segatella copri]
MCLVIFKFISALSTVKLICLRVDIAYTKFSFQIPMFRESPSVAVSYTCTYKPSFIPIVFQLREISAQELEVKIHATDVVRSTQGMEADE